MSRARRIPAAVVMPGRTLQTSMMVNDELAHELMDTPTMLLSYARAQLDKLPARRVPMKIIESEVRTVHNERAWMRGFQKYQVTMRIERVEGA